MIILSGSLTIFKFVHFVYLFPSAHEKWHFAWQRTVFFCTDIRQKSKQFLLILLFDIIFSLFSSIGEYRNRMYNLNCEWNNKLLHLLQFRFNVIEQILFLGPKSIGIAFEMHDDNLYFQYISGLNVAHCDGNALKCVRFRLFGTISDETYKCFFQVATDLSI